MTVEQPEAPHVAAFLDRIAEAVAAAVLAEEREEDERDEEAA